MTWPHHHIRFWRIKSSHVNIETALHLMHAVSFNATVRDSIHLNCGAFNAPQGIFANAPQGIFALNVCLIRRQKRISFLIGPRRLDR